MLLILYFLLSFSMITSRDFITFWVSIEFISLLFFCLLLRTSVGEDFSSPMVYFITQSLSSIGLLFCYLFLCSSGAGLPGVFAFWAIKIGVFPLNFWYFFSMVNMKPIPLFLALTFQKLPRVFILQFIPTEFFRSRRCGIFVLLLLLTFIFTPMTTALTPSLLGLVLVSSIFNNVWIVLAYLRGPPILFLYFTLYTLTIYYLIKSSFSPFLFFTLIGLPPFPLFFLKVIILFLTLNLSGLYSTLSLFMFLLLTGNAVILILYFRFYSSRMMNSFKASFLYFHV